LLFLCVFNSLVRGQNVEHIDKPVNINFIDSIVGAKSSPGQGGSAFEKDGNSFDVLVYSNWQETQISVLVLIERTKDKREIMKDFFVLDYNNLRCQFPDAVLATGIDEQYKERNGKMELDNLVVSIYDYRETDVYGNNPEYYTRILKAWTIDKTRLKFIEIPTKGLTHYNVGFDA